MTSHFAPIDADIQVSKSGSGTVNYKIDWHSNMSWWYRWNHREKNIRLMVNLILGIRSFDVKIDFMRNNNKSFVDMTLLKIDFFFMKTKFV